MSDGNIVTKEIFGYRQNGIAEDGTVLGDFVKSRRVPSVYEKIRRRGFDDVDSLFKKKSGE